MNRRRKILIALACVLSLLILGSIIHHYQLRFALERYLSELKRQGEPLELSQVLPPPVPPERNSAGTLRQAVALFDSIAGSDKSFLATNYIPGMEMVAPGKAMVSWQQPFIQNLDGTNSWTDATTAVAQKAIAYAQLRQIIAKPNFDFSIDYQQVFAGKYLNKLWFDEPGHMVQRLETAALCNLHAGDVTVTVQDLRAMLAMVKALRDERFIIAQSARLRMANNALAVNWELLQSPNVSDKDLASLQKDWSDLDFIHSSKNALLMERAGHLIEAGQWRQSNARLAQLLEENFYGWTSDNYNQSRPSISMRIKSAACSYLWRNWWSYPDELQMLEQYQITLKSLRSAETNRTLLLIYASQTRAMQTTYRLGNDLWIVLDDDLDAHNLLSGSGGFLDSIMHRLLEMETGKQSVIAAIALKRYQLKYHDYPPSMNSLVPKFLTALPYDPIDGKPLRYRRNPDRTFLLYSIGDNGVDDGGNPSTEKGLERYGAWPQRNTLDWVWPRPASQAEIQAYYDNLGKKSG